MTVAVFVPDDHTLKQLPTGIRAADALGHLQSLYGLPSHLGRLRHADGRPVSNDEELNSTTKGYIYSFMINSGLDGSELINSPMLPLPDLIQTTTTSKYDLEVVVERDPDLDAQLLAHQQQQPTGFIGFRNPPVRDSYRTPTTEHTLGQGLQHQAMEPVNDVYKSVSNYYICWADTQEQVSLSSGCSSISGCSMESGPHDHVYTAEFPLERHADDVPDVLQSQRQSILTRVGFSRQSLKPDMTLTVAAEPWQEQQQAMEAAAAGQASDISSTGCDAHAASLAGTSSRWQLPATAATGTYVAAASSAAAAGAAEKLLVLATGVLKPTRIAAKAWGMSGAEFMAAVANCSTDDERDRFCIAEQCAANNVVALAWVQQAVSNAYFTGTTHFILSCYAIAFGGELVCVEEFAAPDGKIKLRAHIRVSGPVYAKDHGPGRGTVRGLFSLLTSKVVRQRYRLRHIACPDVAADAIAVNDQQASSSVHSEQQQHRQQPQQQQQQRDCQQPQQQQPHQWHQGRDPYLAAWNQPLKQFVSMQLEFHSCIASSASTEVFRGRFLGQGAIIKTTSLDWEPAGSYVREAAMYQLLHELQLAGVLCGLLGHGIYADRYIMAMTEAPGIMLSELPRPYSVAVQQAVQGAVSRIHQLNVIHDDLHEGNIFVQHQPGAMPKVTIIDLGRARPVRTPAEQQEEMQHLQQLLGTTAGLAATAKPIMG